MRLTVEGVHRAVVAVGEGGMPMDLPCATTRQGRERKQQPRSVRETQLEHGPEPNAEKPWRTQVFLIVIDVMMIKLDSMYMFTDRITRNALGEYGRKLLPQRLEQPAWLLPQLCFCSFILFCHSSDKMESSARRRGA